MAVPRCPHCNTVLTEAEAAARRCPDCAGPLAAGPAADSPLVGPPAARGRSRVAFPAGLVVGALIASSGAAAWWAWGTPPADHAPGRPAREIEADAQEAARQADVAQAAAEQSLTAVRVRVQTAQGLLAVAEKERSVAETRARAAKERADGLEQAAAKRVAADKSLADALAGLETVKAGQDEQARKAREATLQAEAQRAAADRVLADIKNKLQAARDQQAEADRQVAATRVRLQAAQGQVAALDKEAADKKTRLAERDRTLEARRIQLADLDRALAAKAAKAAAPGAAPVVTGKVPAAAAKTAGGFVRDWLVVGPFPAPDRKGHATAFPPEAGPVDLVKEYKTAAGPAKWRAYASPADYVDLAAALKTEDPAVGYAVCWVRADRAKAVTLSLGSNDGIQVWVNGKSVSDRPVSRAAAPGQDRAAANLAAGWTEVRVKVDNTGGPWGFYLEVRDAGTDKPLPGLEVRTAPPDPAAKK